MLRIPRRVVVGLAVPLTAVAAVAFTAHPALGATTTVPHAVRTDQTQEQQHSPYAPPNTAATQASRTAAASTAATPSRSASPSASTPAAAASAGAAAGAASTNCSGKQAKAPLTVKMGTVRGKQVLVDGDGCTLYVFLQDNQTTSACDTSCEAVWPPAPGPATATAGLQQSNFSTFTRSSSFTQTAFFGKQLYYFSGDRAPGDGNGQGLNQAWFIVDQSGNPIMQ